MNILIDLCHPAHVNFFKMAVILLKGRGHHIKITVLNRGKLPLIARNEFKDCDINIINKHRGTIWSIIVEANFLKFFTLFWICFKFRPDIGLSAGSFVLGAVLKFIGKPNIQFDDDPERRVNVLLEKLTSTFLYFPLFYNKTTNKIGRYNALKEWAYLSPQYFDPDPAVLFNYDLKIKEYIFVREISVGSFNYSGQTENMIVKMANLFPKETKVVLSLENKSSASLCPHNWIILKEPVDKIQSLIYFSKIVISSGDSMAREGALLGVPSIYCGKREMAANKVMIEKKILLHIDVKNVPETVNDIINGVRCFEDQISFRSNIACEWDDVPHFILRKIDLFK